MSMFETLLFSYTLATITMLGYMIAWYALALIWKRNDLADVAWGLGFVVITMVLSLQAENSPTSYLVALLVLIWGVRLSSHILRRVRRKPEDERYAQWRREWKYVKLRSFFQIFLLQGVLMLGVLAPVIIVIAFAPELNWVVLLGAIVWLFGFLFEAVGDAQLATFLANPTNKGKVMNQGLWRYTRHPNYFGEVTQWWGLGIIACTAPFGYLAWVGPVLITFLIVKVSGVPLLEKAMLRNPAYVEYAKRTSQLIPWIPKV